MAFRRLSLVALLLSLATALPTAPALASSEQESIMMDDDLLVYGDDNLRTNTLVRMKQLGVDTVRVTLLWSVAAEGANLTNAEIKRIKSASGRKKARAQRARFDPDNPRTYPTRNWDRFDNIVKDAAGLEMKVFFTITGPGPRFGHRNAPRSQRLNAKTFKPVPTRFREFVEAVGTRYSGTYRDENAIKQPLARVSMWSLWNEPNQSGWLSPQWERRAGQLIPASPALYRQLYLAGREGLASTGHDADTILLAETAPLGSSGRGARTSLRPAPFLRELACIAPNGTPYAGADATRRGCDVDFAKGPLRATGFAHHAYTKKRGPTAAPANPDDLTLANLNVLASLLDRLAAQSGGKLPAALPIWITEFGYESNPPDPRNGIPLARQAEFNQLGEFLAYNNPRVPGVTQFLLRDGAPLRQFKKNSRFYWFTYQSGLFTQKGKAKPAAIAYLLPFVAFRSGPNVGFWGQLRFRPDGSPDVAVIQTRANAQTPWTQLGPPVATSARGFFTVTAPAGPVGTEYRAVYVDPATGNIIFSSLPAKP